MTTSSEDVLLQVSQVKYKKGDGTLYVMNERLAWMMDNRDTVSVSHKYTDIKMQKISPEGKAKIQLQVVLHDGSTSTFQFVNRQGMPAQIKDRDNVKELLVQLLPKFKKKVNKELEEKNRLLSENPGLLQLYRDLVITHVVTSQEFWSQHAVQYTSKLNTQKQDIGVNGAFLADIKPQTDGCNGLKYNLTADVIESIFKTYPTVRQKHLEYVPHKLSEAEFWTKFFQSHYFHRDRINTLCNKDIFTECAKIDDQELTKDLTQGVADPLVNISEFEDKTVDEGYGTMTPSQTCSGNIVHQNMIKRFNQHSIMVLKTCERNTHKQNNNNNVLTNGLQTNEANSNGVVDSDEPQAKKARLQEKITYDDLTSTTDNETTQTTSVTLTKVERYLHGPMPHINNEQRDDLTVTYSKLIKETNTWNVPKRQGTPILISPSNAVSTLGELTPGGILMKGFQEQSTAQMIPKDVEKELLNLYTALCELLRHYWSCFPPTTKQLEEKATNMHSALHRFDNAKIKPFQDRVLRELSPLNHNIGNHLNEMLQLAYRKYNKWQQRVHR